MFPQSDSPADSSTSHKAVTISHDRRKHQRSSSFPFIKSLNPFKRKPSPTSPSADKGSTEPYEVAPGIRSTGATAKVFGYLDIKEDKHKKRRRSVGADERNRPRDRPDKEKQSDCSPGCSPAKILFARYKEAHTDDGHDDFRGRTHRRKVEEGDRKRQERRDDARREREESERRGRRGRMLTVRKEDELVSRGANPRTGLVTPWEANEESGEGDGGGWLSRGRGYTWGQAKERGSSGGKWTQNEHGWSLVQDQASSPVQQREDGKAIRAVSVKEVEDRFVVNMPGVDDPDPPSATAEQNRFYQEGVERAYRKAGASHGFVDPETLRTPRRGTPEGPSTPPNRLQKIRRKEVGSPASERNESTDTVIVNNQARASSSQTPRNDTREMPRVRIVPPSSSASQATKSPDGHHCSHSPAQAQTQRPFLGPRPGRKNSPTMNVIPSHSPLSTHPAPTPLQRKEPKPDETTKWWEQQKKQAGMKPQHEKRDQSPNTDPPPAGPGVGGELSPASQHRGKGEKYHGWVVTNPDAGDLEAPVPGGELEKAVWRGKKSRSPCMCMKCRMGRPQGAKAMQTTEKRGKLAGGNTIKEHVRQNESRDGDGAGCIPTGGCLGDDTVCSGNDGRTSDFKMKALVNERRRRVKVPEIPEMEIPLDSEGVVAGNAWFACTGQWGDEKERGDVACGYDGVEEGEDEEDEDEEDSEMLEGALVRKMMDTWKAIWEMEKRFHASSTAQTVSLRLFGMVQHVLMTLNPASPALRVLRKKDARVEDYFNAVRDLLLAGAYLLVLLNIILAVGKVVRVAMNVLLCAWWPVKAGLAVVRWFAWG
ncbi:hypothetical protein MMC08_002826 [Hypocenomyce scalaris]|nr:hypothetical protein [Hypocenomyce scalaris]